MPINPLEPFLPDPFPYLVYGIITGMLFKPRKWSKNIIYKIFFYYCYLVWIGSMTYMLMGKSQAHQAWFVFGFILTLFSLFRILGLLVRPFSFIAERITESYQEGSYQAEQERRTADQAQAHQANYHGQSHQDILRAEQARREAEMRAYRGQRPSEPTQSQQPTARQNPNEPPHRPRIENDSRAEQRPQDTQTPATRTTERRSSEAILGLVAGWTQEDLRKAHQRESNRTHPDKWMNKPKAMREMMEAEYKAVQEAYRRLKR
jgi:hypothetical protein